MRGALQRARRGSTSAADESGIATAAGKAQAVLSRGTAAVPNQHILLVEDDRDLAAFMSEVFGPRASK